MIPIVTYYVLLTLAVNVELFLPDRVVVIRAEQQKVMLNANKRSVDYRQVPSKVTR